MNESFYTPEEIPPIMSVPEVAKFLGIGKNRTYDLVRSGQLEALHIGHKLRVTRHGLLKFMGIPVQ